MHPTDSARGWLLDPAVTFLNHGSFGACPGEVLRLQTELRERLERQPVQFMVRELEGLMDQARSALGAFLGADSADLAFVPNATTGVNAVVRSFPLESGDEVLTTNHAYNACRNALDYVAASAGARVVVADIPFPVESPDAVVETVLAAATPATRLALLDHITSPTGVVLPIAPIVAELERRGIATLVDGAHAPGMLDLDVPAVGASFYTGNCHKWICAPKGAAFLWVRPDLQRGVRPVNISHGANVMRTDRSKYLVEFDWVGTDDPTPYLCVPAALEWVAAQRPGGWPEVRQHNHELALRARDILCAALEVPPPAPDSMLGSLAAVPIPDSVREPASSALYTDPLQDQLLEHEGIEVPIVPWPRHPKRLVRISAQLYNDVTQYEKLASALLAGLASEAG